MPLNCQRFFFITLFLLVIVCCVQAEILPVKTYTSADGLLRDSAFCIKQDSRGFLWFCTSDGLSRFDGYSFTNYTTDNGLPHRNVTDFLETRDGIYWAATRDGLARFNPKAENSESIFTNFKPENKASASITKLFEDSKGILWGGTEDGLYQIKSENDQIVFKQVEIPKENAGQPLTVSSIIEDSAGNILVGMDFGQGLNRISPDGRVEHFKANRENGVSESIKTLLKTSNGTIWAGLSVDGGLCLLVSELNSQTTIFSKCLTKNDGLPSNWISSLYQTSDGKIWIGSTDGTTIFDSVSEKLHNYNKSQGLCERGINGFLEDRDGNFWIAANCGIKKIVRSGFIRFGIDDGIAANPVNGIYTSPQNELFFITARIVETADKKNITVSQINRFDNDKFSFVEPKLPPNVGSGWGGGQIITQEKNGEWWLAGDKKAVYRFPKTDSIQELGNRKPQIIPIPDDLVFRLYQDSRGNIWISTMYSGHLLKWESASEKLYDYKNEISPDNAVRHANSFAEDANGVLWISIEDSDDLIRYQDGHFSIRKISGENKIGNINTVFFDSKNRLWVATMQNGIGLIEDTRNEELKAVWFNRKKGLSTDGTRGIGEDLFGRIYVGHGRGVDRIEPTSGQIKHFTTADGLPAGLNNNIALDKDGNLWFGGEQGLARMIPEPDKPRPLPNILLTGVRVNGQRQSVSELGEKLLPEFNFAAHQTQVSLDFLGLGASLGEEIKYQYKLEGNWIETTQRTIDFANLTPGSYTFQVRAITFDGLISENPATVSFTIASPFWKSWWFLTLTALALFLLFYSIYRYRVTQLLKIERVRTRIATDLHDDIGSNLSKISVLSEVACLKMANGNEENNRLLHSIAEIARESVGSMSDIVWAINPARDSVLEMTRKMRQHTEETFVPRNVPVKFKTSEINESFKIPMDIRREIYLIFKEVVNNSAKHSNCQNIEIDFSFDGKKLFLQIKDDGRGFDVKKETDGNGLLNIQSRTENLGGKLEIESIKGKGTTVRLIISDFLPT